MPKEDIMDSLARTPLEQRIMAEVQTMLTEGDHAYLQGLSRDALLKTLATELQFLGLYAHDDRETPAAVQTLLEQYIDQWRAAYLMSSEQQMTPDPIVQIREVSSPCPIPTPSSAGTGILLQSESIKYIVRMPSLEPSHTS
jgi:hypothetical protein